MGRHQEGAWGGGGIRLEWTRQIDNTRFRSARNNAKPDQNSAIVWRKVSARPPKVSRDLGRSPGGYNALGGSWIRLGGQDIRHSIVSLVYRKKKQPTASRTPADMLLAAGCRPPGWRICGPKLGPPSYIPIAPSGLSGKLGWRMDYGRLNGSWVMT